MSKQKALTLENVRRAVPIVEERLHDLRRTFALIGSYADAMADSLTTSKSPSDVAQRDAWEGLALLASDGRASVRAIFDAVSDGDVLDSPAPLPGSDNEPA